ncbi:SDR family oxidoreductase [Cytobacillus suaedae]|nr:SDR family oxidoreductase [Cytobacillus suaedae]
MNILVTGSTGFVGKQLTIRLLELGHSVYALIRNHKKAEDLLSSVPLEYKERLLIIEGDITSAGLGISPEVSMTLKDQIHKIYHIAAYLSFDPNEREKSFEINLEGTRNVLEFAKSINVQNFYHVSTAYTLGEKLSANETLHDKDNTFVNPYEESKCHAEHLVFEYKDFFNVTIFRPSIIIGNSVTGEADSTFALYGVIRSFSLLNKRMNRAKNIGDSRFKFLCNKDITQNFVPVDYVIDVLVTAITHAKANTIYHITNSNPPSNQLIFDLVTKSIGTDRVEMVPTDYEGELSPDELRFNQPISVFYKYWERSITFDDRNTRELLEQANLKPLDMDSSMFERIIAAKL